MSQLDELVLFQICLYLMPNDLTQSMSRVCKQWYQVSIGNELWRFQCFRSFSKTPKPKKNKTPPPPISPEAFFRTNPMEKEQPPYHFKSIFFRKIHTKDFIVVKKGSTKSNNILLDNDQNVLEYQVPVWEVVEEKKSKKKDKELIVVKEQMTEQHVGEICAWRDLICVTEVTPMFVVVNLCELTHKQTKKNYLSYRVVTKYIGRRSSLDVPEEKRWEHELTSRGVNMKRV